MQPRLAWRCGLRSHFLPRLRGRIQEGAGHEQGVSKLQIIMISSVERSSLRAQTSTSCYPPTV